MRHVAERLDLLERLRGEQSARGVLDAAAEHTGVHLVGGAVRDALLGAAAQDLDFVVDGPAEPVAAAVAERVGGDLIEHDRFGTSRVKVAGRSYDFATARSERYERPGALPTVEPGAAVEEDLLRRDFTVNAIALAVGPPVPGRLLGAAGALEDLDAGRLRVLHEESFRDDPTRLLRLARYSARLGFEVEPHTATLARAATGGGALDTVAGPRVGNELRLAAREADPLPVFERLAGLGVLGAVHPAMGFDTAFARRAMSALPAEGRSDLVVLAVATLDVPAGEAAALLDRLGFDRHEMRPALALVGRLPEVARTLAGAERASEIDAALSGGTPEEAALVAALGAEVPVGRWLGELRHVSLEIDGEDLRAAGVPEGPAIGAGLAAAHAGRLDGELMTRETQLAAALRMAAT
jgi:tRNA nucleotidyltransferase (CCA-adding enzyme)